MMPQRGATKTFTRFCCCKEYSAILNKEVQITKTSKTSTLCTRCFVICLMSQDRSVCIRPTLIVVYLVIGFRATNNSLNRWTTVVLPCPPSMRTTSTTTRSSERETRSIRSCLLSSRALMWCSRSDPSSYTLTDMYPSLKSQGVSPSSIPSTSNKHVRSGSTTKMLHSRIGDLLTWPSQSEATSTSRSTLRPRWLMRTTLCWKIVEVECLFMSFNFLITL